MEISLSIEETQALRARLGLKPLESHTRTDNQTRTDTRTDNQRDTQPDTQRDTQPNNQRDTQPDNQRDTQPNKRMDKHLLLQKIKQSKNSRPFHVPVNHNTKQVDPVEFHHDFADQEILTLDDSHILDDKFTVNAQSDLQVGEHGDLILANSAPVDRNDSKFQTASYESTPINDYQDPIFKKPKKFKKNIKKVLTVQATREFEFSNSQTDITKINFADDSELQQALALTRRKRVKLGAEAVAINQDKSDDSMTENDGIVITETKEFVDSIDMAMQQNARESIIEPSDPEPLQEPKEPFDATTEPTSSMDVDSNVLEPGETLEKDQTFLQEPLVSGGLASTLLLLKQKGVLEKEDEDKKLQQQRTKDRLEWLALKRTQEAVKSKQKSNRQDNNNNQKDKLEKLEEKFKDYVPSVNLQYRDESGRDLTPKEYYKELSQRFHGKETAKSKKEKKLIKLRNEMIIKNASADDTPLQTSQALAKRNEEMGEAHLALSNAIMPEAPKRKAPVKRPVKEKVQFNLPVTAIKPRQLL